MLTQMQEREAEVRSVWAMCLCDCVAACSCGCVSVHMYADCTTMQYLAQHQEQIRAWQTRLDEETHKALAQLTQVRYTHIHVSRSVGCFMCVLLLGVLSCWSCQFLCILTASLCVCLCPVYCPVSLVGVCVNVRYCLYISLCMYVSIYICICVAIYRTLRQDMSASTMQRNMSAESEQRRFDGASIIRCASVGCVVLPTCRTVPAMFC